jgi:DNA polymerase V
MPSGGYRKESGRKMKWGEPIAKIGVPSSIANDLVRAIEEQWEKGITGKEIIATLNPVDRHKIKKYDYPVSAGANSTSSVGGDSLNTDYEEIDIVEVLIPKPNNTIILPVTGDSMIGIGIYPGDWLIVEQIDSFCQQPKEGDIVIASVNDEVLVKRYRKERGEVVLLSENENHKPIRYSGGSIYITGIVKNSIRRNLSKS